MKKISLMGASGSIGTQTLDIIRQHPDEFQLVAFSVGNNINFARQVINEFHPELVSVLEKVQWRCLKLSFHAYHLHMDNSV